MAGVIIALPSAKDISSIRSVLIRGGFEVAAASTSGAGVLLAADRMAEGIVLCGTRMKDMTALQLRESLPQQFPMILLSSAAAAGDGSVPGIIPVRLPLRVHTLLEVLRKTQSGMGARPRRNRGPAQRTRQDQEIILRAKERLMEAHRMTEEEAHRYLQKTSMDSGTGLTETARMLLELMGEDR